MEPNSHCDRRQSGSNRTRRTRSQIFYGVFPDGDSPDYEAFFRPRGESTTAAFHGQAPLLGAWKEEPAPGSLRANKTVAKMMAKMGYKIGMDVGRPPAVASLPATVGVGCVKEAKPFPA